MWPSDLLAYEAFFLSTRNYGAMAMNLKHHWKENIKPAIQFFIAGMFLGAGVITVNWIIPVKPVEYQICIQDAGGDYMCEVYK
jgi:hypothetical protein